MEQHGFRPKRNNYALVCLVSVLSLISSLPNWISSQGADATPSMRSSDAAGIALRESGGAGMAIRTNNLRWGRPGGDDLDWWRWCAGGFWPYLSLYGGTEPRDRGARFHSRFSWTLAWNRYANWVSTGSSENREESIAFGSETPADIG